jgi:hypothetical protein
VGILQKILEKSKFKADTIAFTEGGTEAMRIDSDGNVKITHGNKFYADTSSGGTTRTAEIIMYESSSGAIQLKTNNSSTGGIEFFTQGAERMRIDTSGRVFIGTTTQTISSTQSGEIKSTGATGFAIVNTTAGNNPLSVHNQGTSGTRRLIQFLEGAGGGTVRGFISTDGSTVAYNTTSDYRLKENVTYDFDATTRLKQLKPARFNFIDDANKTVDGFLAHEVSNIIPEATTGTKDATETKEKVVVNVNGKIIDENIEQADWEVSKIPNEEGTSKYPVDSTWEASKVVPVYQAIDQAKLTPILTKALQEAIARIEQLEARLTALES